MQLRDGYIRIACVFSQFGQSSSRRPLSSGQTHYWVNVPIPEGRVDKNKARQRGSSVQQACIGDHPVSQLLGEVTSKIMSHSVQGSSSERGRASRQDNVQDLGVRIKAEGQLLRLGEYKRLGKSLGLGASRPLRPNLRGKLFFIPHGTGLRAGIDPGPMYGLI